MQLMYDCCKKELALEQNVQLPSIEARSGAQLAAAYYGKGLTCKQQRTTTPSTLHIRKSEGWLFGTIVLCDRGGCSLGDGRLQSSRPPVCSRQGPGSGSSLEQQLTLAQEQRGDEAACAEVVVSL